jgi:hypothetical protein
VLSLTLSTFLPIVTFCFWTESAPRNTYPRLRLCTRVQTPPDNLTRPTPPCRTTQDRGTTTRTAVHRRPSSSSMARRRRRTMAPRECEIGSAKGEC